MCHHWTSGRDRTWEEVRDELPEEDPEGEEPGPDPDAEPVPRTAEDD